MAGGSAWEEDMWEGLQIGSLNLSAVKPCDRCKVSPSHNPIADAMTMQTS